MATATWLGGHSGNSANDPANWAGGTLPGAGDTVLVGSGALGAAVTLDVVGNSQTPEAVTDITLQVGGAFDTLSFFDTVMSGVTLVAGNGTADGQGLVFLLGADAPAAGGINDTSFSVGDYGTIDIAGIGNNSANVTIDAGNHVVVGLTDSQVAAVDMTFGDDATLNLTGTSGPSGAYLSSSGNGSGPRISQGVAGGTFTINATGTANIDNSLWFTGAGDAVTVNVAQSGTSAGYLGLTGALINAGGTVTINGDGNTGTRFSNNGFALVYAGVAAAQDVLNARMNGIGGQFYLLGSHGATLDVNTNMPGAQSITFGDANGLLKIEDVTLSSAFSVGGTPTTAQQNFFGRISGFRAGDTIDLVGAKPVSGTLTYSYGNDADYGNNVLIISDGASAVARLRIGASHVDGTGTLDGAHSGAFVLTSQGNDVLVTLASTETLVNGGTTVIPTAAAEWGGVADGTTTDWTAANWSGGTGTAGQPGVFQNVDIGLSAAQADAAVQSGELTSYVFTVTTPVTVGSVNYDDPSATLVVSAAIATQSLPGQGSGGNFTANAGRMEITATGSLTTNHFTVGSQSGVTIEAGGHLAAAGIASFTNGGGQSAIEVGNYLESDGGTIAATGAIAIGGNAIGSMQVTNDNPTFDVGGNSYGGVGAAVTATYTQIGSSIAGGAQNGQSSLTIAGPQTSWTDAGGDASTALSGAMLVGGGNLTMNGLGQISFQAGGSGMLRIMDGATLTDASYAIIGVSRNSTGTVEMSNGAAWSIGAGTVTPPGSIVAGNAVVGTATLYSSNLPWLVVGSGGTGLLDINSSRVTLGTGEAFNTAKIVIGNGNATNDAASGVVNVNGAGALIDSGGGPMIVGQRSAGTLNIGNGGTVIVGAAAGDTAIGWGLGIGNQSGSLGSFRGVVNVNPGGVLVDDGDLVVGRNNEGTLQLASGATATVTGGVYLGGQRALSNGTVAISPTLVQGSNHSGNYLAIGSGATMTTGATLDLFQGATVVVNGALSIGTTATVPGSLTIAAGARIQGVGTLTVASGSSLLNNDGTVIAGGLTSSGTLVQAGGTLEVTAALGGGGLFKVAPGGVLQLDSATPTTARFAFDTSGTLTETIRVLSPTAFHGDVGGFYGAARHVDLAGATLSGGGQLTYTANADATTGGTVSLPTTLGTVTFSVTGWHPGGFSTASDLGGGLVVNAVDAAPCFTAGTMILTESGERPVESLRPGDMVPVLAGRFCRVVWVGRTRVEPGRHPAPETVAPVRIRAGALADGVPRRDLVVSPDHALWTDGQLVPAYLLVNGTTIRRETEVGSVHYHHVELERHGLLLAEGAPAESYLDTGNRGQFAGEAGVRGLHPDMLDAIGARAWDVRACAVLALGGPGVAAAHRRIAMRAGVLGHALTEDPALAVMLADGRRLGQLGPAGGRLLVPAGTSRILLRSRHAVPRELDAASGDRRRLGVALSRIRFASRDVTLAGACATGFHAPERAGTAQFRWTDGQAELRLPPAPRAAWLELELVPGLLRYAMEAAA